ncbi:phosphate ABC transporter substrate-binding protein [Thermodesulfovibrio hydrogeniphilus]
MVKLLFFVLFISLILSNNAVFADDLELFKDLKGTIRIAGGTAHIPVMEDLAKQIMEKYPDIKISIAGGGSGLGIKQAGEGLIDIGNSGREISQDEINKYGLKVYRWAMDGIAIIVHPNNPIKNLTKAQLKDIYSGKITNWKELGGIDRQINIYTRPDDSGTREVFWTKGLEKGVITPKAIVVPSNGAMKVAVSKDTAAIGYVSVGYVDKTVKPLYFDNIEPTIENIVSGKYTISRGLYSVTKEKVSPLTAAFIRLLYSDLGKKTITKHGLIPAK